MKRGTPSPAARAARDGGHCRRQRSRRWRPLGIVARPGRLAGLGVERENLALIVAQAPGRRRPAGDSSTAAARPRRCGAGCRRASSTTSADSGSPRLIGGQACAPRSRLRGATLVRLDEPANVGQSSDGFGLGPTARRPRSELASAVGILALAARPGVPRRRDASARRLAARRAPGRASPP